MSFKDAYYKSLSGRVYRWQKLDASLDELVVDEKEYAVRLLRNDPKCGERTLEILFRKLGYPVTRDWISEWRNHYDI
jgi:hypothetical protein